MADLRQFQERYSTLLHDLREFVRGLREIGLKDDANALSEIVSEAPAASLIPSKAAPVVDEAMVERALNARPFVGRGSGARVWQLVIDERDAREIVRAALTAALAQQPSAALDYVPGRIDREAPDRIWLQIDTAGDNDDRDCPWPGSDGVTWQDESVGGLEIEYVRADLAQQPNAALDARRWKEFCRQSDLGEFPPGLLEDAKNMGAGVLEMHIDDSLAAQQPGGDR